MSAPDLTAGTRPARSGIARYLPGLLIAVTVCLAAVAVAGRYDAPVMLFALLFGAVLSFLSEDTRLRPGIEYAASTGLKLGIALMGANVSVDILRGLGPSVVVLTLCLSLAVLLLGLVLGRLAGWGGPQAVIAAGSVAICGASAALALASVLPAFRDKSDHVIVVIVTATGLSTAAMVFYPVILGQLGLTPMQSGVMLGASIHDVAQVIGAGLSISPEVAEIAILTKMLRVAFLPVVLIGVAAAFGAGSNGTRLRLPWFLTAFVLLMLIGNLVPVPEEVTQALTDLSRALLYVAVAALGLCSAPKQMLRSSRKTLGIGLALTLVLAASATLAVSVLV